MSHIPSRAIVSLEEKKVGARIFCTNLFLDNQNVLFFTGFGPTQEVRAFAQLLAHEGTLVVTDEAGANIERIYGARTENQIWIAKGPEGQSLIYSLPRGTAQIFAPSEDEARTVFYRLLEQQQFVLKDWFPVLFSELPRLQPTVGSMFGCDSMANVEARVKEGLAAQDFRFPPPTAHLVLEQSEKKGSGKGVIA